jgi:probable O-glycosylation ligase (exosortase A-associated)
MKGLLFTYLLCYGGMIVSLFNPFIGLLIYVSFALLMPNSLWGFAVGSGNYSRIVAVALLAGWLLKGFGNWQFGKARPMVVSLVGFWLWTALGAIQAPEPEIAWSAAEALAKIVLPFLVGITVIDSVQKLKQLAWVILLSQGYVALEFNLSYFQGYNRIQEDAFGSLDNNSIAIVLVANTALGFFLGINAEPWWRKAVALGFAACSAHAVLFSFSRGGMLGLAVVALVGFVLIPKRPMHIAIFAVAVLLSLRLAGTEVRQRFMTSFHNPEERDGSAQSRLDLWANCWDSMLKHPLFGHGPNHWPLVVQEYGWPKGKAAHSLWMQVGAENGFPGLLLLVFFYTSCVFWLWPQAYRGQALADPWFQDCARMVCASLIGFIVAAQFVSIWGVELPYYIALVGAGALRLTSGPPSWYPRTVGHQSSEPVPRSSAA